MAIWPVLSLAALAVIGGLYFGPEIPRYLAATLGEYPVQLSSNQELLVGSWPVVIAFVISFIF